MWLLWELLALRTQANKLVFKAALPPLLWVPVVDILLHPNHHRHPHIDK